MEFRRQQNADGSLEVIRVLNDVSLDEWSRQDPLSFEKSIVWLYPIDEVDFVRVATIRTATSRRGPLYVSGVGMVVGYSKLTVDAPRRAATNTFQRRLFYLTEDDLQLNLNQVPPGVFDPKTILPGVRGTGPCRGDIDRGYPWWVQLDMLPQSAGGFVASI